jgi:hypothetical protein
VRKGEYSPWEKQHGFNDENALRNDESRADECEIKPRKLRLRNANVVLLSRAQWADRGRKVVDGAVPVKVVVTKRGRPLKIFSLEQTVNLDVECSSIAARKK